MREAAAPVAPDRVADVAVVIVAHWSGPVLDDCVTRVLDDAAVGEIVVVDNGSGDGSTEALGARHGGDARVRLVRNAGNPGFAAACNQGAAESRAAFVAFLNPDCLVERDTFARLRAIAASEPRLGVLGADVRDQAGVPEPAARRREPTWRRALARMLGRDDADGLHVPPAADARAPTEVDAVSGALMFVSRAAFERVGGFDAGYRLHCEDLDLCRRMRDAGLRVLVAETVRVEHMKGSSSRRRPLFVAFHKHRGMARYFRKFGRDGMALPLALLIEAGIWLRFLASLPVLLVRDLRARLR